MFVEYSWWVTTIRFTASPINLTSRRWAIPYKLIALKSVVWLKKYMQIENWDKEFGATLKVLLWFYHKRSMP